MSEPPPLRGIVVGHGEMARGLVDAVQSVSGVGDDVLVAVSNRDRGPDELIAELSKLLDRGPTLVFTDMQAGSCALAALAAASRGDVAVVCGANLPMLLDFVFRRDEGLAELVPRLVRTGREGIRTLPDGRASA